MLNAVVWQTHVPCEETGDTGPWVSLQLFRQLKDVLHDDGLMSHALHQGMFLHALHVHINEWKVMVVTTIVTK